MASNGVVAGNEFSAGLHRIYGTDGATSDDVIKYYGDNADKYEKVFIGERQFRGPELTTEYFQKHAQRMNLDKNCHILDVAAGTGLVGQILQREGYTNIDAVDGSQAMLDLARDKGAYRNYFQCNIGPDHALPMQDDFYDVGLISGGVAPAHIKPEGLFEVIRVIKPGGLVINTMREVYSFDCPNFDVRTVFNQWERDGRWRLREWAIPSSFKYVANLDAIVQVFEIT